jgi:hypothetical protein
LALFPRKKILRIVSEVKDLTVNVKDWDRGEEVGAASVRPITPDWLTEDKTRHPRPSKQDAVPERARMPKFDSLIPSSRNLTYRIIGRLSEPICVREVIGLWIRF